MIKTVSFCVCVMMFLVTSAGEMQANPSRNNPTALKLFHEGRKYMKQGDYTNARTKLEASLSLEPTLGATLNLAVCYERLGMLASAWSLYQEAQEMAMQAKDKEREEYARNRGRILAPRLSSIVIVAPYMEIIPDMKIARNGKAIDSSLWGESLYVDPGFHQITVVARDYQTYTTEVQIKEGKEAVVRIPMLKSQPVISESSHELPSSWWSQHRKSAVTGSVSLALFGAGLGLGRLTWSSYDTLARTCGGTSTGCSEQEIDEVNRKAMATNAVLGASAAAAATTLFFYFFMEGKKQPYLSGVSVFPTNSGVGMSFSY